eukprot:scpid3325/ scgid0538/ Aggrecan core protein; Cartilage-specific proteoglycan core protein
MAWSVLPLQSYILVILLALSGEELTLVSACTAPWSSLAGTSYCFIKSGWHGTYTGAQWVCNTRHGGAVLPRIYTSTMNNALRDFMAPLTEVWLGASDRKVEGDFKWDDTTSTVRYGWQNWSPGQPDDHLGKEDCVEMWGWDHGRWNDADCELWKDIICMSPGPTQCGLSSWGHWGSCSDSCNPGTQYRYRSIQVQPAYGGLPCPHLSESQSCNTGLRQCNIGGRCWSNGYVDTANCLTCNAWYTWTRNSWQAQSGASCNDRDSCTKSDVCRSGSCSGTRYSCSSCESCNGAGGCNVNAFRCRIQGSCYNNGNTNSQSPQCQYCSSSWGGSTGWTNRPNGTTCSDGDICTRKDFCNQHGQCQPGYNYKHECVSPCQACSTSGYCAYVKGCVSNGKCGCWIGGRCYADRTPQPGKKCHQCNFGLNPYGWSRMADGRTCDDGNLCTYQDRCTSGVCAGTGYSCPIGGPCMAKNTCNGNAPSPLGCVVTYYGTSTTCYHQKDQCDHPNTSCTGTLAACAHTSLKLLTGTPIVLGSITLQQASDGSNLPLGPINHFHLGSVSGGFVSSTTSIQLLLQKYTVPCDKVTYTVQLYHLKSNFDVPAGGSVLTLSDGKTSITTQSASGAAVQIPVNAPLVQNNVYRFRIAASNVRLNTLSSVSLPFLVDSTPPTFTGVIYDGAKPAIKIQYEDNDYQSIMVSLSIHWPVSEIKDLESGIDLTSYRMSIGTLAGTDNILFGHQCAAVDLSNGQCKAAGLTLVSGTKYYCTLQVANRAGLLSKFTSDGITADDSSPETGQLSINLPSSLSNSERVLNTVTLDLKFQLANTRDTQSGLKVLEWQICETTSAVAVCSSQGYKIFVCSAFPCTTHITQPSDKITSSKGFLDNHSYTLQIRVTNQADLVSSTSQEFVVDYTAPRSGTVNDGLVGDAVYQSSTSILSANWNGFYDAGLGIHHFEWSILQSDKVTKRVYPYTGVGRKTNATATGLQLSHATKYIVCVKAVDIAGNSATECSNGVTLDAQPPAGGTVLDVDVTTGTLVDIDYQMYLTQLRSRWQGFTALSGIASYTWGIGTAPGKYDVATARPYGLTTQAIVPGLKLTSGVRYYAVVSCTSKVGRTTTVSSDGVTIDTSPPVSGQVIDLCSDGCASTDDANYTSTNTQFNLRWAGFTDAQSGIRKYYWNYAYCGHSILLNPSDFDAGSNTESSGTVAVTTSVRYCMQVRAVNKAGLSSVAWSDGVLVDITPPDGFVIVDGLHLSRDRDHQNDHTQLTATWSKSSDFQSGVSHLTMAAGTAQRSANVKSAVRLNSSLSSYTLTSLSLSDLNEYYVTVCAVNNANISTCISTDGVLIDQTAPTKGIILTGTGLAGRLFQSNTSTLAARWSAFEDIHSDIAGFKLAIGTTSDPTYIQPFTDVGLALSTEVTKLNLQSGQTYVVSVEAINTAGSNISSRSVGITIDDSSPVFQQKPVLTMQGSVATLKWPGVADNVSGIWYYQWSLGVSCNGNQLLGYINAANVTTQSQANLTLITGQVYYGSVVARNRAGQHTQWCTSPVLYDGTPPSVQYVVIGKSTHQNMLYMKNTSYVPCTWSQPIDHESGVGKCTADIINVNSSALLGSASEDNNSTSLLVQLHTAPKTGEALQCRVSCLNGFGMSSAKVSPSTIFDDTPPASSRVQAQKYWSSTTRLTASWSACVDAESGITAYEWAIGTTTDPYSVLASANVGLNLEATASGLAMVDQGTYMVTVTCTNGAGLNTTMASQQVTIDTSPPGVSGPVLATFQLALNSISASWPAAIDKESGIDGYEWSIGVNSGGCQVLDSMHIGNVLNATCSNCSITAGEKYYITVRAINSAKLKSSMATSVLILDTTPPTPGSVTCRDVMTSRAKVKCSNFYDHEPTGIKSCNWALMNHSTLINTSSTGCDCSNCSFQVPIPFGGSSSDDQFTRLKLDIMCTDYANLSATKSVIVDITPPSISSLTCSAFSSNVSALRASFSGIKDPQTSIRLRWCVGLNALQDIMSWTAQGIDQEQGILQSSALALVGGQAYTMYLEATNSDDLSTRMNCKTFIDTTPPIAGNVNDGETGVDVDYTPMSRVISATWSGFHDSESSLTYRWCIGHSNGREEMMVYRSVGSATAGTCHTCKLVSGVKYIVTVQAINKAGLVTTMSSDGIMLDSSPPTQGYVQEGSDKQQYLVVYHLGPSAPSLYWNGYADQQSGIDSCSLSIRTENDSVLWERENTGVNESPLTPNVTLPSGETLFTHIACKNGAGLESKRSSSGFVVDITPPLPGVVSVTWATIQDDMPALRITCSGFKDPESGLANFDIVLHDNSTQMVAQVNSVRVNTSFTLPVSNTTDGELYQATVTARNGVGLTALVKSKPLVFDSTAPSIGAVLDGPPGTHDMNYTNSTTLIEAHWETITDLDSGVEEFHFAIGTSPGGTQILNYTAAGTNTSASCGPPLCLIEGGGMLYFTTVRAENGAGKVSWFTSDGVTVDNTPPITSVITLNNQTTDQAVYLTANGSLDVSWENATDLESPIADYSICLGSAAERCDVEQWTSTGLITSFNQQFNPEKLSGTTSAVANVKITNAAGLFSVMTSSSVVIIDNSPPEKGHVIDGHGMSDIDCQDSTVPLAAQWSGFTDTESYIVAYEWSIGSQPYSDDIKGWVSAGLNQSAEISSSAALSKLSDFVFVTVRAINGAGLSTEAASDGVRLLHDLDRGPSGRTDVANLCISYAEDSQP